MAHHDQFGSLPKRRSVGTAIFGIWLDRGAQGRANWSGVLRIVIETPKGSRNKYDYDPDTDTFELAKVLPEGMNFPFDFGFVPSTLAEDGDPLDVLVLMDAPAVPGCTLKVRALGAIEARQKE